MNIDTKNKIKKMIYLMCHSIVIISSITVIGTLYKYINIFSTSKYYISGFIFLVGLFSWFAYCSVLTIIDEVLS